MFEKIFKLFFLVVIVAFALKVYFTFIRGVDDVPEERVFKKKETLVEEKVEKAKEISAHDLLFQAEALYEEKRYKEAKEKLDVLIKAYPKSDKADNVVNLLAKIEKEFQKERGASKKREVTDPEKIKRLAGKMKKKRDEEKKITWYRDKSSPSFTNRNGIFLYFQKRDELDHASNLRLKIQYLGDEWLDIESFLYNIDGKMYNHKPSKINRGGGGKERKWEWSNDKVDHDLYKIVKAIAESDYAEVTILGGKSNKTIKVESHQRQAIRNTLDAYRALGGSFSFK